MARVLFLSHAGIDTDTADAKALKARILATPEARAAGLRVRFNKDDLDPRKLWQREIEATIASSHVFLLFVGSKLPVNWVEAEVRLALRRVIAEPHYRFIAVLAARASTRETCPASCSCSRASATLNPAPISSRSC